MTMLLIPVRCSSCSASSVRHISYSLFYSLTTAAFFTFTYELICFETIPAAEHVSTSMGRVFNFLVTENEERVVSRVVE